ncbi:glycosyltransferase [Psychroflexus sediminis]|uniref:Glycosyltransferase involved in cell wall bisynthesis n=1 Tax=Psychroflexus sediminis TaxID=470826 RepID=A0A1G7Z548_9FLAO|nr:glycosyltransferase [Psychroflexus sediminis]SDH03729.1 Glycosyltransferase involved in cell wall bisynthesis [Psychroflexus sediminis]
MNGISVIICCYNSEQRIKPTLEHLNLQQTNFPWELIIVDNNCTDATVQTVKNCTKQMHQLAGRTSIVNESEPGLNYARLRGVKASKYDLVLFCDDDNWLNKSYLQRGFNFLKNNPDFGVVGGSGIEKCEIAAPQWFDKYKSLYAIGCRNDGEVSNVYGAGMLLRKELLSGIDFSMSDRKGDSLASGGDSEICYNVINKGFKIRQLCDNTFYHFIPKERLKNAYIYKMFYAVGKTRKELYKISPKHYKLFNPSYRLRKDLKNLFRAVMKLDWISVKCNFYSLKAYWLN